MSNKEEVNNEKWSVNMTEDSLFQAPETRHIFLQGDVYGHPRFEDGKTVVTSRLVVFDLMSKTATTRTGTEYTLGEMHPDFVSWLISQGYSTETLEKINKQEE